MSLVKVVNQYSLEGVLLARYPSLSNASTFSEAQVAHIGKVVNGKRTTAGGYSWKTINSLGTVLTGKVRGVQQIDVLSGEIVAIYNSLETSSLMSGITSSKIQRSIDGRGAPEGYRFVLA